MSLDLHTQQLKHALILTFRGRLDSITSNQIESELLTTVENSALPIIFDLAHLDYIASAGLRIILMVAKRAKAQNNTFLLCQLQPQVYHVFEVSGFIKIMAVYDDLDSALQSLHL